MTEPRVQKVNVNRTVRRQALHASVIRACRCCGAPGYWHNTPGVNVGCYAPDKVTQLGMDPVGDQCPNCGAPRQTIEHRGQIWSREWRVSLWAILRDAAREIFPAIRWRKHNEG